MTRPEGSLRLALLLAALAACGDGSNDADDRRCRIVDDSLTLQDGESCVLSPEQQRPYRLNGFDEASCDQGRLLFNSRDGAGVQFGGRGAGGSGVDFNGLFIRCEAPSDAGAALAPSLVTDGAGNPPLPSRHARVALRAGT